MNKILKYILTLILAISFGSCDKVPNNGVLDGMWQLMSVEHDGDVTNTKDSQAYWSIRTNLVQFSDLTGKNKFAHFKRSGDELQIFDLCHESRNENEKDNDEWITYEEREIMYKYGIHPELDSNHNGILSQTFRFVLLNDDNMILTSGKYKLVFRKF